MSADQTSQAAVRAAEAVFQDTTQAGVNLAEVAHPDAWKADWAEIIERECRCNEAREIIESCKGILDQLLQPDMQTSAVTIYDQARQAEMKARKFLER